MADEHVVTLDSFLANPTAASGLSLELASELLSKLNGLRAVLLKRVAAESILTTAGAPLVPATSQRPVSPAWGAEDLLTVDEAAAILRVSPRWLYRHAKKLPFSRKLSRKVLRFSRAGIARWLATNRA